MGLDAFGRMVRDIRLVRALLLYDMREDLIFLRLSCLPSNAEEKMFQTGSSLNYKKHTVSAICTLNRLSNI